MPGSGDNDMTVSNHATQPNTHSVVICRGAPMQTLERSNDDRND